MIEFYEQEIFPVLGDYRVDGLIGFTPDFASDLLGLVGPQKIGEHVFSQENLYELLQYEVEQGFAERGIPFEQRKEILGKLIEQVARVLVALPLQDWDELGGLIERNFREKQLMVYDRGPLQVFLEEQGWAGRIEPGLGDFFLVVDANLGSLKSDPVVKRSIDYRLEPRENGWEATVKIQYRHEGRFDWKTTRYRTYTRLYVPRGSRLIRVTGHLRDDKLKNPAQEIGQVEVSEEFFGAFLAVEPGQERDLSFTYQLPDWIGQMISEQKIYSLKVSKQLGSAAHNLTLDLDFGKRVRSAAPAEESAEFNDHRYRLQTNLTEDRNFLINF